MKNIFKVYFLEKNIGLGKALNFGIPKCKNELIARFDSDDINLKNKLKIQYDFCKENPDISIIGSNIIEFKTINKDLFLKKMSNNHKEKSTNYMIRNPLNHPSVLFRKKDILRVGSYKDVKHFEDYELWLRCLKNGLKIHNINKELVAMKRTSYLSKRNGLKYALFEYKFLKEAIKENTLKISVIPIYVIRILIRLLPTKLSFLIKKFDQKRFGKKIDFDLSEYINQIKNNPISLYNQFLKK